MASSAKVGGNRPEISVYWAPGCSMCLNTKEFLEARGIPFESLNVFEREDAVQELAAVGLRGLPVVRQGKKFTYVQSLDVVAEFLNISRGDQRRLTQDELIERWDQLLAKAQTLIEGFDEQVLARPAMLTRPRPVRDLSSHVFQIVEVFVRLLEEGLVEYEDLQNRPRPGIVTRDDLLSYIDTTLIRFRMWRQARGSERIPAKLLTYYGEQPSYYVLERGVWHSAQHARQLDTVAAGLGSEYQIPPDLYASLPMPKRLWA